jgi:hypothetical protein
MTRDLLISELQPLLAVLRGLDPSDPGACERALAAVDTAALRDATLEAWREGWLAPRESGGVRWGRVLKATEGAGLSVDAVEMAGPASGSHRHPRGEFDLCFPVEAGARFDGRADRWVVYPPDSRHVPTVTGGKMVLLYFLPGGEIDFSP